MVSGGCMILGGCMVRGGAWSGGCMVPGGAWSQGGAGGDPPMATAAGGTHPTGMHSCFIQILSPMRETINSSWHMTRPLTI